MSTVANTPAATASPASAKKPAATTSARVDALISAAKARGQKLAERNPKLAAVVQEAGEKNASVEQARQAAREARETARKLRLDQRAQDQAAREKRRAERKEAAAAKAAAKAA